MNFYKNVEIQMINMHWSCRELENQYIGRVGKRHLNNTCNVNHIKARLHVFYFLKLVIARYN